MNAERWQRIQRLLDGARERPAAEREAFVRELAGDDAELAEEVLRLLRIEPDPGFLSPPGTPPGPMPRRLGDFELMEELGRGRFGVVYRARQLSLGGRIVAVKVLTPSVTISRTDTDRFERESRTAARLHHPNIVQILTVGEENGERYFAMDLVTGPTLADEIRRLRSEHGLGSKSNAHLPSSRAENYFRVVAELVRQVADGLAFAHQHGVVHRDIKPGNLMLHADGRALIVDFGLARDEDEGTITKSDVIAGTPHYMSPEQASGYFHRVDLRTDVYSLGVVLYELLTLSRPFEGRSTHEILRNIREREPARIDRLNPRVPRDLRVICATAMAKAPGERFASAGALRDDLGRFLAGEAILVQPPSPLQVVVRSVRRHRRLVAAALLALATLGAGLWIAGAVIADRRIAALTSVVDQGLAEGPLRALPLSRLLDLRRALSELRRRPGVLAAEAEDRVARAEQELDELRQDMTTRGRDGLARARDGARPEGARELDRLTGLMTLMDASYLFPEDEALRELARVESAFPTIEVRALDENGEAALADVYLREVDVTTSGVGERRRLGRAPLTPTPVVPGYYRVEVQFDSGGFRELICNPGPAFMKIELTAQRRADESRLVADMVRIEACAPVIREVPGMEVYGGRPVSLGAFWIDRAEVSNAQYRAFVLATQGRLPRFWNLVDDWDEFLREHGDLPVIGTTWNDAVAYAEWAGKRLPTAAEWNRASGGPGAWVTPYSPDPGAAPLGNVSRPIEPVVGELARWQKYLRFAVPVRSSPEACTPEGLFHMWGNVYERTESMTLAALGPDRALVPQQYERLLYGGGWDAVAQQVPMYAHNSEWLASDFINDRSGFRCAKSAAP